MLLRQSLSDKPTNRGECFSRRYGELPRVGKPGAGFSVVFLMREPTRCPACSTETLSSYHLERPDAQVHECAACGGVWVPREVVQTLGRKKETESLPEAQPPGPYRPCPACNVLMSRKRCGPVVLDVCTLHGVWFDRGELNSFVGWAQASLLTFLPEQNHESRWLDAFQSLELLEPVGMLLGAVCGLFDV